ncbi:integral membrane protein [Rutstroemia sp. NJR-2017a WRK4]|nr:integral membrane protein [Rutstroemia sp. NJR-2017a WRK4]
MLASPSSLDKAITNNAMSTLRAQNRSFDKNIPLILRPLIRAYLLGYASSTGPRLLTLCLVHLSRRRKNIDERLDEYFLSSFLKILRGGLELQRFPTFCAALVGGSTSLQARDVFSLDQILLGCIPIREILGKLAHKLSDRTQLRLTRFLSAFISAWFSLKLLQSRQSKTFTEVIPHETQNGGIEFRPTRFAGRTMDLTLFAVTRAADVVVGELWARHKASRVGKGKWSKIEQTISTLTDPTVFAFSCALIMWSFIYTPARLPLAYTKWIHSFARVDRRLLITLRRCRYGELKYGVETGQAPLLQEMCRDYNLPLEFGDPVKSIPFPCELVHMGCGKSCEWHAIVRFARSWVCALKMYAPLNLLLILRHPSRKSLLKSLRSSLRSSTFLATFIALYWYGICLTRTRLGPHVLGRTPHAAQALDSGYAIAMGSALCGWSVLLEGQKKRMDMGLFVAPRALATLLPRRYEERWEWRENVAFAVGTGVLVVGVGEGRVRGVLGRVLGGVLGG